MGWQIYEVKRKHHNIFVEFSTVGSIAYQQYWNYVLWSKAQAAKFKRLTNEGIFLVRATTIKAGSKNAPFLDFKANQTTRL